MKRTTNPNSPEAVLKLLLFIALICIMISSLSCKQAEVIQPDLKNDPSLIVYNVNFKSHSPKRVIAVLYQATWSGDQLQECGRVDTIMTSSGRLGLFLPYGKYAYVSLKVLCCSEPDYVSMGVDYDEDEADEIHRGNSCAVDSMEIPEMYIEIKTK